MRSGETLVAIVNDLLDVSKLEAGRLELEAIPFSLHALISQLMTAVASPAHDKGTGAA